LVILLDHARAGLGRIVLSNFMDHVRVKENIRVRDGAKEAILLK
jgi:hypothetical protein